MVEKNKGFGVKALVLVAATFLIVGLMVSAGFDITGSTNAGSGDKDSPFWHEGPGAASPSGALKLTSPVPGFADLAEKLAPAVVNVSTTNVVKGGVNMPFPGFKGSPFEDFFGDDFFKRFFDDNQRELKRKSLGSGFIINKDGYILTNNHVIKDATEIIVTLSEGSKEFEAEVVGKDEKLDLALIKINAKNHLPVVNLGDSERLRIGEWVLAIGNPFGLGGTVTAGIVSQKGRFIGAGPYDDFIQTDASINPGNSGGPLFNLQGEVVGINSVIIAGGQGIGFAIPINSVKDILLQLKDKGSITRGWIGVSIQELTPELSSHFKLKDGAGVLISAVTPGEPAEKAGIKAGDIIVEFDGRPITELNELPRAVAATAPGKTSKVKVLRDGKLKTLSVTVAERADDDKPSSADTTGSGTKGEVTDKELGVTVKSLTPSIIEKFGLETQVKGVLISEVVEGSAASMAGLRSGDIIKEINRKKVKNPDEFSTEMARADRKNILFLVSRGKSVFYVTIGIMG